VEVNFLDGRRWILASAVAKASKIAMAVFLAGSLISRLADDLANLVQAASMRMGVRWVSCGAGTPARELSASEGRS
jgi:hypothetical protein